MWWLVGGRRSPHARHENPVPTAYDELSFAEGAYRHGRVQEDVFFSRNFRILKEVASVDSNVKLITYVPNFFPTRQARLQYDYDRLPEKITVGFVFRGTDRDLVGNLKADFDLLWSKLFESNLPQVARKICSEVFLQLHELREWYPGLFKDGRKLSIYVCGHSLGGFLSEVATVVLSDYISREGWTWHCTSFESPGLPSEFVELALGQHGPEHWRKIMIGYLAAPNPINMLHTHLGRIVHIKVPFEQSVSHLVRCISADASRVWLLGSLACGVGHACHAMTQPDMVLNLPAIVAGLARGLLNGTTSLSPMQALAKVSAAVTAALGVEVEEIVAQHDALAMYIAFDRETGDVKPAYAQEMDGWPCLTGVHYSPATAIQKALIALLPSFVCPTNVGIANMLDRQGLVQRRIAALPGYCPSATASNLRIADVTGAPTPLAIMPPPAGGPGCSSWQPEPVPSPPPPAEAEALAKMQAAAAKAMDKLRAPALGNSVAGREVAPEVEIVGEIMPNQVPPQPMSAREMGDRDEDGGDRKRPRLEQGGHNPVHMLHGIACALVTGGLSRLGLGQPHQASAQLAPAALM